MSDYRLVILYVKNCVVENMADIFFRRKAPLRRPLAPHWPRRWMLEPSSAVVWTSGVPRERPWAVIQTCAIINFLNVSNTSENASVHNYNATFIVIMLVILYYM